MHVVTAIRTRQRRIQDFFNGGWLIPIGHQLNTLIYFKLSCVCHGDLGRRWEGRIGDRNTEKSKNATKIEEIEPNRNTLLNLVGRK